MNNILHFKSKSQKAIDFLKEGIDIIEKQQADNVMIAIKLKDGSNYVMTGYCNLSQGDKMELLGHIHADIIDQMIRERYVEGN